MSDTKTVTIRINQQQRVLLERLRQEKTFGNTFAEVVVNLLRAHAEQMRERKE